MLHFIKALVSWGVSSEDELPPGIPSAFLNSGLGPAPLSPLEVAVLGGAFAFSLLAE